MSTDSVPTTQYPKRKMGTIALWPCARRVIAWLHCVVLFDWVWNEWSDNRAQRMRTAHRHVCVSCGVWWCGVVGGGWERMKKSGGVVDRKGGVKDTVTQKQKDVLFHQTTFPSSPFHPLFPNSFLSRLSPAVPSSTLYHPSIFLFMHNTFTHP